MNTPTEAYNNLTLDSIQQGVINQMNNWKNTTNSTEGTVNFNEIFTTARVLGDLISNGKGYTKTRNHLLFLIHTFNKDLMLIAANCYGNGYLGSLSDRILPVLSDASAICGLIQIIDESRDNLMECASDNSYCAVGLHDAVSEIAIDLYEAGEEEPKLVKRLVFMLSEVAYTLEKDKFNTKRSAEGINSFMAR